MMNPAPALPLVQTYLFFSGKCEEALNFYAKHLGAKTGIMLRFNESPDPIPEGMIPAGFENKIMHCDFTIGSTTFMASDGCLTSEAESTNFALSLMVKTQEEAQKTFNALAEGGKVLMPLDKTFWSPCYGQVKDRFGLVWMVTIPPEM